MKRNVSILLLVALLFGCKSQRDRTPSPEPNYFLNLYTQEVLSKDAYNAFIDSLDVAYADTVEGHFITIHTKPIITDESGDSVIMPFIYDVRVGTEYKIRSKEYPRIGTNIAEKRLKTVTGDSVQIGGKQSKPTLINLWFIGCGGCRAEIPALNHLQKKYADRVNFIALTDGNEKDVRTFLKKTPYTFTHAASQNWKYDETSLRPYIDAIKSYPYPENIFIDRNGIIRYVEGLMPTIGSLDDCTKHSEMILDKLLKE